MINEAHQQSADSADNPNPRLVRRVRSGVQNIRKNKNERAGKDAASISIEFEFDRATVTGELQSLRRAVEEGANQLEMVAAEKVFGKSLSRALIRRARKLHLVARDLANLLRLIARARIAPSAR
jgi:hypothetical protein